MKKLFPYAFVLALAAASCSSAPPPARAAALPPERAERPERIMGTGAVPAPRLEAFLLGANPGADRAAVRELAAAYVAESAAEGVNHDVAFAQMCVETGFLKFGGLVTADMHNYCGLGSIGPGKPGERFPTARIGVRAHVQHLKAYASSEPLRGAVVDPRFRYVKRGTAPTIAGLSGTWAADPRYAQKIRDVVGRLYGASQ
jgi:hypothetical protein